MHLQSGERKGMGGEKKEWALYELKEGNIIAFIWIWCYLGFQADAESNHFPRDNRREQILEKTHLKIKKLLKVSCYMDFDLLVYNFLIFYSEWSYYFKILKSSLGTKKHCLSFNNLSPLFPVPREKSFMLLLESPYLLPLETQARTSTLRPCLS